MTPEFSPTEIIFNMAWRTLSHAAVPAMLPATSLDANGLIPRSFCPQVYDGVKKTVTDMREEGQYAAWYWVVPPYQNDGEKARESIDWHPCFTLPANRRIVARDVNPNITAHLEPLMHRRRAVSSSLPSSSTKPNYSDYASDGRNRRASGDSTRRMSLVREESKSDESISDTARMRARTNASLHVRPLMVRK